jgi:hypothetical protein
MLKKICAPGLLLKIKGQIEETREIMRTYKESGARVFYLDECMFTSRTYL